MKRTNLVLDERILEEALRLGGERTYSRTVEKALEEFVRRIRAGRILSLAGSGLWDGNLSEIRGDRRDALRERVDEDGKRPGRATGTKTRRRRAGTGRVSR